MATDNLGSGFDTRVKIVIFLASAVSFLTQPGMLFILDIIIMYWLDYHYKHTGYNRPPYNNYGHALATLHFKSTSIQYMAVQL